MTTTQNSTEAGLWVASFSYWSALRGQYTLVVAHDEKSARKAARTKWNTRGTRGCHLAPVADFLANVERLVPLYETRAAESAVTREQRGLTGEGPSAVELRQLLATRDELTQVPA